MPFSDLSRAWRARHRSADAPGALLLCHGFTGTPQSLRPWGEHQAERGWEVSIPLLPGHATTWQDLAATDRTAWTDALASEARELIARHGRIAVGGLSMGGALALALAEDPGLAPGIAALVLVNPALALPRVQRLAVPVLQRVVASVGAIGADTRNGAVEEAYDRTPVRGVEQLRRLQRDVRRRLPDVRCPVLVATSAEDHVVDPRCSDLVAARVRGPVERLALPDSFHVATLDHDAPRLFEAASAFLDRVATAARPDAERPGTEH